MSQFELSRDSIAYRLLLILSFLFPVGMGSIPHWTSSIFYLFSLVSIICIGFRWFVYERMMKYLIVAFFIYFFVSLLSLINSEDIGAGVRRLEKMFFLFCFIPSFVAIRRLNMDLAIPFLWGILVAGPVLAGIAVNAVYMTDLSRAHAAYSPIIFGDMAMLNALLIFAAYLAGWLSGWRNLIGLFAFFLSLYASMLSGSRGAWLALPIVGLFLLWSLRKRTLWKKFAVVASMYVVLVVVIPSNYMGKREISIGKNIIQFQSGEEVNTPEGQRFMLWRIALSVWKEHPIIGTGIGDYRCETKKYIEAGQTDLNVDYGHAHNIFLDALATTGLLGLSALIGALFIVPARIFLTIGLEWPRKQTNFPVLAGLTLLISFAVFGLTEGWLARSPMVSVFVFGLLVFLSSALHGEKHV